MGITFEKSSTGRNETVTLLDGGQRVVKTLEPTSNQPVTLVALRTLSGLLTPDSKCAWTSVQVERDCTIDAAVAALLLDRLTQLSLSPGDMVRLASSFSGITASVIHSAEPPTGISIPASHVWASLRRWAEYACREHFRQEIWTPPPFRFGALLTAMQRLEPTLLTERFRALQEPGVDLGALDYRARNPLYEMPISREHLGWHYWWNFIERDWHEFCNSVVEAARNPQYRECKFVRCNEPEYAVFVKLRHTPQLWPYWARNLRHVPTPWPLHTLWLIDELGKAVGITNGEVQERYASGGIRDEVLEGLRRECQTDAWDSLNALGARFACVEFPAASAGKPKDREITRFADVMTMGPPDDGYRFATVKIPDGCGLDIDSDLGRDVLRSHLWHLIRPNVRPGYPTDFETRHFQSDLGTLSVWSRVGLAMAYSHEGEAAVSEDRRVFEGLTRLCLDAASAIPEQDDQEQSSNKEDLDGLLARYAHWATQLAQPRYRLLRRFWDGVHQQDVVERLAERHAANKQVTFLTKIQRIQEKLEWFEVFVISVYVVELLHLYHSFEKEKPHGMGMLLGAFILLLITAGFTYRVLVHKNGWTWKWRAIFYAVVLFLPLLLLLPGLQAWLSSLMALIFGGH